MRRACLRIIAIFLLLASLLLATTLCLAGVRWTANGVELRVGESGTHGSAKNFQITSDGAGGAIVTWQDNRSGYYHIYAQKIDSGGNPQWSANGVELRGAEVIAEAENPQITSDGEGGAIVTWEDTRREDQYGRRFDIYAQRVNSSGSPVWTPNGVELRGTGVDVNAYDPQITSDGAGGAIVTWDDLRSVQSGIYARRIDAGGNPQWTANGVKLLEGNGSGNPNYPQITGDCSGGAIVTCSGYGYLSIYAQRVDSSGSPAWTPDGVELRGYSGVWGCAINPQITSDGAGGAIVTWGDSRNGQDDIYAQRIDSSGSPAWTANGVELRGAGVTGDVFYPQITGDGAGGAIVTWPDPRSGQSDIYARRIDSGGNPLWTANGVELRGTGVTGDAVNPRITSGGAGGAIVTWEDRRSGQWNIYAQRIDSGGNPQWTANGVELRGSGFSNNANNPRITGDGAGGAIVTWQDWRFSFGDIYAQRVGSSGTPAWAVNGVVLRGGGSAVYLPQITSDGRGGAIITWWDNRSSQLNIYAQRIDSGGNPQWSANGVVLRGDGIAGDAFFPQITGDGAGGAIVAWVDYRNGQYCIYAQRVNSAGSCAWTANGVELRGAGVTGFVYSPQITGDGAGGAIVAWVDYRNGQGDIYARRIDSGGNPQWTANGVELRGAGVTGGAYYEQITSDGAGGAIVTWQDNRNSQDDIYARRIDSGGNPQWTANGVELRGNGVTDDGNNPQITGDGAGGAIVTWEDGRSGSQYDIYAQRVNSSGSPAWTANGVELRGAGVSHSAYKPQITSDGTGGAIVTWSDHRSISLNIYAQRVDSSGSPAWTPNGVELRGNGVTGSAYYEQITSDGTGGAIVTWQDDRGGQWDIYAQRIDSGGNPQWSANGVELRGAGVTDDANNPQIAGDGAGGAIVSWEDWRSGRPGVYAQRVSRNAPTISGIAPSSGTKDGMVDVADLSGTGFFSPDYGSGPIEPMVKLKRAGEADIEATNVSVVSSTRITCSFDLTGAVVGAWDVYVENPDGQAATLAGGFNVQSGFYFAEGYTGAGFQEYLCFANPGGEEAVATITYMFPDGTDQVQQLAIPAQSRATVDVNAVVGPDREVSAEVTSGSPLVVERPMYFAYQGAWTGGHVVVGAGTPSDAWYFAEGYTGPGFIEYVCVLNPGNSQADLTFRFQTQEEGEKVVENLAVPANSRRTFSVNDLLGGSYQTSLELTSSQPVVAERPMYFDYGGTTGERRWQGGHCVMGASSLSSEYLFAEGTTRSGFETWLTIQNPHDQVITVDATYHLGEGQGDAVVKSYDIGPGSRYTVLLEGEVGAGVDVSAHLSSAATFLAERPTYFIYGDAWPGGHCVIGAPAPATEWLFAEGYTGDSNPFRTWLCLQNPGTENARVQLTYYTQDEGELPPQDITVPAGTRVSLLLNDQVGGDYRLSFKVTSDRPIVAERPMYFDYNGMTGGHADLGYTL